MQSPLPATVPPYQGLELLATAILVVDPQLKIRYANPAAESLFAFSLRSAAGQALQRVLPGNPVLFSLLAQVNQNQAGFSENELTLEMHGTTQLHLSCIATPLEGEQLLLEFHPLDQQLKIAREEKLLEHQQLNRELIRNLAHEIRNPLGGIRGAAQLLERELPHVSLKEYTQIIVNEADRLQALMDRLLTPHRVPQRAMLNIHEVLERVRTLVLAEFTDGIRICRDYDTSLPELSGDKEQLIQAFLNIARNAAQALEGRGEIRLITRIARQITLARQRYRHALVIHIVDNGPGVPESLADKIFYPLVSGREGGTGVGLSLAQHYISLHQGIIEFTSHPGETRFTVYLPLQEITTQAKP
ncbi:MAG: nitrogen regulation protein NR(II) [Betaproteobacteria bacterium]|nr:nitrogen regulation protein NR(II) [Betaproteobacteria bacterium]